MGSKTLPRMRGRTSALSHLNDRIKKTQEEITLIESLEYGVYEGILEGSQWIKDRTFERTAAQLLCEVDSINKESVRVNVLAVKHLTPYEVISLVGKPTKISIPFQEFKVFKLRELKLEEIPLYCNLDHVTAAFRKRYMM